MSLQLVKLGGSLITDKQQRATFRAEIMQRVAKEIHEALSSANFQLILGHGSGSFGHFEAREYNTITGVHTPQEWYGFARVGLAAANLSLKVTSVLVDAGLPAVRFQPSSMSIAEDGRIVEMPLKPLIHALEHGVMPVVHGDVAMDILRGGTIVSTETVFDYLCRQLPVRRLFLLGEVDGVLDQNLHIISEITPYNFDDVRGLLGASSGVDVTGGMLSKVQDMLALVQFKPEMEVCILNGRTPGLLKAALHDEAISGTWIRNHSTR